MFLLKAEVSSVKHTTLVTLKKNPIKQYIAIKITKKYHSHKPLIILVCQTKYIMYFQLYTKKHGHIL